MSIANQSTAEVYGLSGVLENTLKGVLVYRSDSRNPSLVASVDNQLAALKVLVDAAVADAEPTPG